MGTHNSKMGIKKYLPNSLNYIICIIIIFMGITYLFYDKENWFSWLVGWKIYKCISHDKLTSIIINTKIAEYHIDSKSKNKRKFWTSYQLSKNWILWCFLCWDLSFAECATWTFRNISKSPHFKTCSKNIFLL